MANNYNLYKPRKKRRGLLFLIFIILGLIIIFSYFSFLLGNNDKASISNNGVAVIPIEGVITLEEGDVFPFEQGTASSKAIIEKIEKAEKSNDIKAIILSINSPGGTVVASSNVADAVKSAEKPVVAYIQELGASGAYWIASASDSIVAEPLSITGSIGVISSYLEFSQLFEKYGVSYQRLVSGPYKDIGSPFKELTQEERDLLQNKIDIIHDEFISQVSQNRNIPESSVRELATGLFYLGKEAQQLKLVDELGNFEVARKKAEQLAGIENSNIIKYEEKGKFGILDLITKTFAFYIGKGIGSALTIYQEPLPIRA